ncbi:hypothetical protein NQ314_014348 [Rhamnusium bicolor]|uniref:DDE Tnp4 domain-containing protein n=1 Tax=Rhamnusium bicolor TaxID=1586634 RepID=A0AAV8X1V7_9CUCU|nr:hypothetical protein NQ314_014348 [Rhamnusium bicolor]
MTRFSRCDRFNVANSTTCVLINEVCEYIHFLSSRIIRWPTECESQIVAKNFFKLCGIPDTIGAIDCCHINITVPAGQHDSYLDRKFNYSVVLQGICTSKKLYTNIFVGFPGAAHDSRISTINHVLKESYLNKCIEETGEERFFYVKYHLIGDSAYPCKTWLLHLTGLSRVKLRYNIKLGSTRVKIENSFALLVDRWRILNFVNVYSIQKVVRIIRACCVLHNYCLLKCDVMDDVNQQVLGYNDPIIYEPEDHAGLIKRDQIPRLI